MKTKVAKKKRSTVAAKATKKVALKKAANKKSPAAPKRTAAKAASKTTAPKKQTPPAKQTHIHAFPGYPQYPASEDITRNSKKVDADIEDLSLSKTATKKVKAPVSSKLKAKTADEFVDESLKNASTELTREDYEALGPKDLSLDMGDDEELKHRKSPIDFAGSDMDVPGSELDDDAESTGSEDEENNSYSIGGDNHEDLEEDKS